MNPKFTQFLIEISLEDHFDTFIKRKYPQLSYDSYTFAASLDPTTRGNTRGKYVEWILKLASNIAISWGEPVENTIKKWKMFSYQPDSFPHQLTKTLQKFSTIPSRPNIDTFEQYTLLVEYVNEHYKPSGKEIKEQEKEIFTKPDDIKIIDVTDEWIIARPLTWEGSQKLACYKTTRGADWCTARKNSDEHWKMYSKGELYIFINKNNPSQKFQVFKNENGSLTEYKNFHNESIEREYAFDLMLMSDKLKQYSNIDEIDKLLQTDLNVYKYSKSEKGVTVKENVLMFNRMFEKLPVKFYRVLGKFYLRNCPNLNTLEGSPEFCQEFIVESCPNITTLEGGPQRVSTQYEISWSGLKTLKGCPTTVVGNFTISFCPELNVLDDAPQGDVEFFGIEYCGPYFTDTPKYEILERLEELGCKPEETSFV
jgi:hypothetical protein